MLVIAKSVVGREFFYDASSAHAVSKRSANTIKDVLNERGWNLKPNEVWHIHEVDKYDRAYDFAQTQRFAIYKGIVKRIGY